MNSFKSNWKTEDWLTREWSIERLQKILKVICRMLLRSFVFIGFNALEHAEQEIFQKMLAAGKAEVFWDVDEIS